MIEKEYDPADVGVPDITVPDQVAQVGLVTEERAADSFTDGVYEYATPTFPVVLGLLVNNRSPFSRNACDGHGPVLPARQCAGG